MKFNGYSIIYAIGFNDCVVGIAMMVKGRGTGPVYETSSGMVEKCSFIFDMSAIHGRQILESHRGEASVYKAKLCAQLNDTQLC